MRYLLLLLLSPIVFADESLALTTIKKFGKNLKSELQKGMKISPLQALRSCNIKAPIIAQKNSSKNFKIGRVSLKNRNPNNYPKKWMMKYINGFHSKEITKPYIVIDNPNGRKVMLKPINTMPLCLNCHGSKIESKLKTEILKLYPKDKAIDYKVGQIRGFFWVEYENAGHKK